MAQVSREVEDFLMYFILMERVPVGARAVEPGRLCCMSEESYIQSVTGDQTPAQSLSVTVIEDNVLIDVDVNNLQPLSQRQAALLLAIHNPTERLSCFLERGLLEQAVQAEVGQRVLVEHEQKLFPALIHHLGNTLDSSTLLPPVYFGVELEGEGEGRGNMDGSYKGVTFFKCKKNSGLLLPFNKVLFSGAPPSDDSGSSYLQTGSVNAGDKVAFFVEDSLKRGIVVFSSNQAATGFVEVVLEGIPSSELLKVPLDSIVKEDIASPDQSPGHDGKSASREEQEKVLFKERYLEVDSLVQIQYKEGELTFGIIRWLGYLPQKEDVMVGVELEEDKGCTDGSWCGQRYFFCPPKRGIFVKLKACQPDTRFLSSRDGSPKSLESPKHSREDSHPLSGKVPPLQGAAAVDTLEGDMRGIQGHCNSCYMDAALFSLFSCSSVLDSLLFKPSSLPDGKIQQTLREEIVNPLRRNGFVSADSVMTLRCQLMEESQCPSFTTSEKDPEEFLNLIMHRILGSDPLLKLQCEDQRVQESYCYQIFIEKQQEMTVPNVQQLLEQSFHHSRLKLAEVPSCFIIQMPRFGKEYKMFSKIVPSLELDVTDLLSDSPRECVVCGNLATHECAECFNDIILSDYGLKQYCAVCSTQVHSHHKRKDHKPVLLQIPDAFLKAPNKIPREKLELFAVLCIETSHYVSFVKYGTEKGSWMFFDSMADRFGSENGYNIPRVTLCPEVATYLAAPLSDLVNQNPREMKGVAKRLFCDAYMYMYQSKRMALYK
ncbi:ubiquitin carboxyl-terminal hydrolase CYLD-like [Hyla sarda]|uniref:ubiquitin carboxyl-terminal hydrolase CYLD-like n=1 Tax=Hyla sarda TaxID=327740 RepID=UPI0024C38DEF|nr:ubiquitin carboxyl-terminal hydrolase CYLD-like [Hyla sarda]XP_056378868.1 ubiquitin carboxyl-terminal hydrolase CYLD-like [Hyla sarda]